MKRRLLELAEEPGLWLPSEPKRTVFQSENFAFVTYGRSAWVHRLRIKKIDVERVVNHVDAIIGLKELTEATWWLGELTRPRDLDERLLEYAFEPDDPPEMTSLTIADRPAGEPERAVEVKRAETLEDLLQALEIDWETWGIDDDERELRRREAAEAWPVLQADGRQSTFIGYLDGEPVGYGRSILTPHGVLLLGGGTLPDARGQGVYTSIVHARWDEAVERGVPRLVVSAGPESAPILEKLGFGQIGRVRLMRQKLT